MATTHFEDLGPDDVTDFELPPIGTCRWVTRRKAQVVEGVRRGTITLEDALNRYCLSIEEFISWQRLFNRHGME
ncbi:MAG: DUF1153 domain-containing protein, partial [Pseudomonadota bacterium]|nr:DUF1153 domain-containing protein [Pseudomonadota bacterium]